LVVRGGEKDRERPRTHAGSLASDPFIHAPTKSDSTAEMQRQMERSAEKVWKISLRVLSVPLRFKKSFGTPSQPKRLVIGWPLSQTVKGRMLGE